jgi:hypothetical protein
MANIQHKLCRNLLISTSFLSIALPLPSLASEITSSDAERASFEDIEHFEIASLADTLSEEAPAPVEIIAASNRDLIGPPAPLESPVPAAIEPDANIGIETIAQGARLHLPYEQSSHRGFWQQAGAIKTELVILGGYVALQSVPKLFKETQSFRFKNEGWFGKDTNNVGVDKMTHALNTYLIAELLHYRLHRNTGGSEGDPITAAAIAVGAMAINELSDAIEPNGGYSMQDITMNIAGATFSVLRNTIPGLKEKLSFKVEVVPNKHIYSREGKEHFAQQRYMFSLKGAGFEGLRNSPLRYLDAQVGYYASDFLLEDRANGVIPKRHLFVGLGLNVGELLFSQSKSRIGRAAHSLLDYVQLPYTSLRYDTTGKFGF